MVLIFHALSCNDDACCGEQNNWHKYPFERQDNSTSFKLPESTAWALFSYPGEVSMATVKYQQVASRSEMRESKCRLRSVPRTYIWMCNASTKIVTAWLHPWRRHKPIMAWGVPGNKPHDARRNTKSIAILHPCDCLVVVLSFQPVSCILIE